MSHSSVLKKILKYSMNIIKLANVNNHSACVMGSTNTRHVSSTIKTQQQLQQPTW